MRPRRYLHVADMTDTAFEQLAAVLRPVILGQCKRLHAAHNMSYCEVQDLVQIVHLRLWSQQAAVIHSRHPRAYTARLARNAILRYAQRNGRRHIPPIDTAVFADYAAA